MDLRDDHHLTEGESEDADFRAESSRSRVVQSPGRLCAGLCVRRRSTRLPTAVRKVG